MSCAVRSPQHHPADSNTQSQGVDVMAPSGEESRKCGQELTVRERARAMGALREGASRSKAAQTSAEDDALRRRVPEAPDSPAYRPSSHRGTEHQHGYDAAKTASWRGATCPTQSPARVKSRDSSPAIDLGCLIERCHARGEVSLLDN